jgi:hypothetical protein
LREGERLRRKGGDTGAEEGPHHGTSALSIDRERDILLQAMIRQNLETAVAQGHPGRHDSIGGLDNWLF